MRCCSSSSPTDDHAQVAGPPRRASYLAPASAVVLPAPLPTSRTCAGPRHPAGATAPSEPASCTPRAAPRATSRTRSTSANDGTGGPSHGGRPGGRAPAGSAASARADATPSTGHADRGLAVELLGLRAQDLGLAGQHRHEVASGARREQREHLVADPDAPSARSSFIGSASGSRPSAAHTARVSARRRRASAGRRRRAGAPSRRARRSRSRAAG